MFTGTYTPKVDAKGRLFLPAKFRESFQEGLVVTKGQEDSLFVQTMSDFEAFTERFKNAPVTDARMRAYARVVFGGAEVQELDAQGRIMIPPALREYAGLEREAVVVGVFDRVEIWRPDAWATYLEQESRAFSEMSEELPGF